MAIEEGEYVYLTSYLSRLRGMLFRKRSSDTYILTPCNSIHTCFMKCAIDVAFVDRGGVVIEVVRNLQPMKLYKNKRAYATCERVASNTSWFEVGDSCLVFLEGR